WLDPFACAGEAPEQDRAAARGRTRIFERAAANRPHVHAGTCSGEHARCKVRGSAVLAAALLHDVTKEHEAPEELFWITSLRDLRVPRPFMMTECWEPSPHGGANRRCYLRTRLVGRTFADRQRQAEVRARCRSDERQRSAVGLRNAERDREAEPGASPTFF